MCNWLVTWPWEGGKAMERQRWWRKTRLALLSDTLIWLNLETQPPNGQDINPVAPHQHLG